MGISVDILSAEGILAWGLHNVDGWQACATKTTCLTCWSDDPRNGTEMGLWTEATSVDYESYFRQAREPVVRKTAVSRSVRAVGAKARDLFLFRTTNRPRLTLRMWISPLSMSGWRKARTSAMGRKSRASRSSMGK